MCSFFHLEYDNILLGDELMITKEDIISSIKYVVDNSQYVKINKEKINETIELLQKS